MRDKCVYVHQIPRGPIFYVGMGATDRPYKRCGRNKAWHGMVSLIGGSFNAIIVASDLTVEEACRIEKEFIASIGLDNLVNKSIGGQYSAYGMRHTDDSKRKISMNSASHRPEWKAHLRQVMVGSGNPMYGRTHGETARSKISDSRSDKTIYQFKYNGVDFPLTRAMFRAITGATVERSHALVKRGKSYKGWTCNA